MMLKVTVVSLLLGCGAVCAHEDPHDVIHALSHKLEHASEEAQGDLYFQRAMEYRAAGQKEKMKADLLRYTELVPEDYLGWLELGGIVDDAVKQLAYLNEALEVACSDSEKAVSNDALAKYFYVRKDYEKALSYCESSIRLGEKKTLTPMLFKAHLLCLLGEMNGRVKFLTEAKQVHPSVVLENAWVDAMIDAGRGAEVKRLILTEVEQSRLKSSWLIRAARCEARHSKQQEDYAQLAINEIRQRLNVKRPDVTLWMDLARASLMTGEHDEALRYLKFAKTLNFHPWAMVELEREVEMWRPRAR